MWAQQEQPSDAKSSGPRYVIADLGTVGGGFNNSFGLNERNQVGGGSVFPALPAHAFRCHVPASCIVAPISTIGSDVWGTEYTKGGSYELE